MGDVVLLHKAGNRAATGLTRRECEAVEVRAALLMDQGFACGTVSHREWKYIDVFDRHGKPYSVNRMNRHYYLSDPEETVLARSEHFDDVLDALETRLTTSPDNRA